MKPVERTVLVEHCRYLGDEIFGTVLGLVSGTGAMFLHSEEAASDGSNLILFAIWPDPHIRWQAAE